jgi:hypothetical protein
MKNNRGGYGGREKSEIALELKRECFRQAPLSLLKQPLHFFRHLDLPMPSPPPL